MKQWGRASVAVAAHNKSGESGCWWSVWPADSSGDFRRDGSQCLLPVGYNRQGGTVNIPLEVGHWLCLETPLYGYSDLILPPRSSHSPPRSGKPSLGPWWLEGAADGQPHNPAVLHAAAKKGKHLAQIPFPYPRPIPPFRSHSLARAWKCL